MALVRFNSFYYGPSAVYTSPTGMTDPITGLPQLGGDFAVGNYCDLTEDEAQVWTQQYGNVYHAGRYRICKLSPSATAANTGFGKPLGWASGTFLAQVALAAGGSGYTNGNFVCSSTTSGGTQKATCNVVVSGGAIISAQLVTAGAGFTSVPTFSLSELSGGSGGSILAQMYESANVVTTFDSSAVALSTVRGICLTTLTPAQITAGAYIVVQELGVAPLLVTTATDTAAGDVAYATTGATVVTNVPTSWHQATIGHTLDVSAASTLVRVVLELPALQG